MPTASATRTKFPLNVWQEDKSGDLYAFPEAKDEWGEEILPSFNITEWTFKYTLPAGIPVSNVTTVKGNKVQCDLRGGVTVFTADWALS